MQVAWSLSYELIFYAVFAIVMLVEMSVFTLVAVLWAGVILLKVTKMLVLPVPPLMPVSPLILQFLAGCAAAWIVTSWRPAVRWRWVIVAAALCVAVGIAETRELVGKYDNVRNYIVPFFLLVTLGAAAENTRPVAVPANPAPGRRRVLLYLPHPLPPAGSRLLPGDPPLSDSADGDRPRGDALALGARVDRPRHHRLLDHRAPAAHLLAPRPRPRARAARR